MRKTFKGRIALDIRKAKPDWPAFLDAKAPPGAPNVLVILYDDTGQAGWSHSAQDGLMDRADATGTRT
jgi:arylsulfatase